ncbi:MAG: UxaA family hydrolase [Verrucomicrobiae bacterium]|nr:UxaA family hydrolase [Verrucomicrobiae bacterium]NNJ43648.1 UxaA family hydrolase [Akkermansiaceae bacterium]
MENSNDQEVYEARQGGGLLRLSPDDNVLIATRVISAGSRVEIDAASWILKNQIGLGHKIAARAIAQGEKIIKCHVAIGSATEPIAPGQHIHLHNMKSDYLPTYDRGGLV